MTVSKINPVNNYAGDSSVTRFDFDFLIEDERELLVQHTDSSGIHVDTPVQTAVVFPLQAAKASAFS